MVWPPPDCFPSLEKVGFHSRKPSWQGASCQLASPLVPLRDGGPVHVCGSSRCAFVSCFSLGSLDLVGSTGDHAAAWHCDNAMLPGDSKDYILLRGGGFGTFLASSAAGCTLQRGSIPCRCVIPTQAPCGIAREQRCQPLKQNRIPLTTAGLAVTWDSQHASRTPCSCSSAFPDCRPPAGSFTLFSAWTLGPRAALGSARCLNAAAHSLPQCGGSAGARQGPVRAHGLPFFSSAAQRAGAAALRAAASGGAGGRRKREPPPATVGRKLADAPSVAARRTGKHAPRSPRVPKDVAARVEELAALGESENGSKGNTQAAAQAKGTELLQARRPSWRCGVRRPLSAARAFVFCCTGCHARAATREQPRASSHASRREPLPR